MRRLSIEEIVEALQSLRRSAGIARKAHSFWHHRLHVAERSDGVFEMFVEGERSTFGDRAVGRGYAYGEFEDAESGRGFSALVISTPILDGQFRRAAHLIYEAIELLILVPDASNIELLDRIEPYLVLLGRSQLLSFEQQIGLAGEMMLVAELLEFGQRHGIAADVVLAKWHGWDSASRDTAGCGVAIEVKTTAQAKRHHWVHPAYQLLPSAGSNERVFVYSVGIRADRSHSFRLCNAVERVTELLTSAERKTMEMRLGQYGGVGFHFDHWNQYQLEPGLVVALGPLLFRVDHLDDVLRPEAFVRGTPPSRVVDVSYQVSLDGLPALSSSEREAVFLELLS